MERSEVGDVGWRVLGLALAVGLSLVPALGCNQQASVDGWDHRTASDAGVRDAVNDARAQADGADATIRCESRADCPDGQICARQWSETPECIEAKACRSHLMCPKEGTLCLPRQSEAGEDVQRRCRPLGEATAGESCAMDTACRSGKCRDGGCAARCRTNAGCPNGELCHPDQGYCRQAECQTSCEDPEFCTGEGCANPLCRRTGDCGACRLVDYCDERSCFGMAGQPGTGLGTCRPTFQGGPYCSPSSFRLRGDDPYCRRAVICEQKDDHQACPTSFYCVVNAKPADGETLYMCGQQVMSARDWPPNGD